MHLWKYHFFHYYFYPPQRPEVVSFICSLDTQQFNAFFHSILAMASLLLEGKCMFRILVVTTNQLYFLKNRTQVTKEICILKWSPARLESTLPEMLIVLQIFWFFSFGIAFRSTFTNHIKNSCHYFRSHLIYGKEHERPKVGNMPKATSPLCMGVCKAQRVNELETHCNNMKQTILMLYTLTLA